METLRRGTFFKFVGEDGRDLRTRQDDYADLVGWTLYLTTPVTHGYSCCTNDVLHASKTFQSGLSVARQLMFSGPIRSRLLRVFVVRGTPLSSHGDKHGFREYDVLRELGAAAIEREIRAMTTFNTRHSVRPRKLNEREVESELRWFAKTHDKATRKMLAQKGAL